MGIIYIIFQKKIPGGEELDGLSSTVATSGYKNEAEVQSVSLSVMWGNDNTTLLRVA